MVLQGSVGAFADGRGGKGAIPVGTRSQWADLMPRIGHVGPVYERRMNAPLGADEYALLPVPWACASARCLQINQTFPFGLSLSRAEGQPLSNSPSLTSTCPKRADATFNSDNDMKDGRGQMRRPILPVVLSAPTWHNVPYAMATLRLQLTSLIRFAARLLVSIAAARPTR